MPLQQYLRKLSLSKQNLDDICQRAVSTSEGIYTGIKYNESWLKKKEKGKFQEYWVVLKNTHLYFFKDQNTHLKEQYVGLIDLTQDTEVTPFGGKKEGKCDLKIKCQKSVYILRAYYDILRDRWIHAINLCIHHLQPGPLPGDEDFVEICFVNNNQTGKNIQRAQSERRPQDNTLSRRDKKPSLDMTTRPPIPLPVSPTRLPPTGGVSESHTIKDGTVYDRVAFVDEVNRIPWYCPGMQRQDAECALNTTPIGTYLLRDVSNAKPGDAYTISVKDTDRIKHHKVIRLGTRYFYEGCEQKEFPTITEAILCMLHHTYKNLFPTAYVKEPMKEMVAGRVPGDGMDNSPEFNKEVEKNPSPVTKNVYTGRSATIGPSVGKCQRKMSDITFNRPLPQIPSVNDDDEESTYTNDIAIRLNSVLKPQGKSLFPAKSFDASTLPIPTQKNCYSEQRRYSHDNASVIKANDSDPRPTLSQGHHVLSEIQDFNEGDDDALDDHDYVNVSDENDDACGLPPPVPPRNYCLSATEDCDDDNVNVSFENNA